MSKIQHVPCSVTKFSQEQESGNLEKVKIIVMHSGENYNKTSISDEAVEDAKETLKNVPILAYIKRDEDGEAIDFDQHNVITKIVQGEDGYEVKQFFLERPIGVIPETNNYRIEEIEGMNHVVVDGYIWKCYSNEGYSLISEAGEKGVSMEINVEEGFKDKKTGIYNITKYSYLGVTTLGDDVAPAMGNTCKLETYSSNSDFVQAMEELNEEVKKYQMEVGTVDNTQTQEQVVETTEVQETVESTETTEVEETSVETSEETTEVPQNYSLSVENLGMSMRKIMSEMTTQKTNRWNETYQVQSYYLRTILPSECIAIVEDGVCDYTYYGVPYSVKGDEVVLDFDNKKEYIQTWREKQTESETIVTFCEKEEDEQKAIEARFSLKEGEIEKLKTQISEQEVELENLRTFKFEKDQEALNEAVSNIVTKFSILEESEYKEIMDKTINGEMSVNDFELHMYAMKGKKQEALELEQAEIAKFSKKDEKSEASRIPVTSHINPEMFSSKGRYGNLEADLVRISGKQD